MRLQKYLAQCGVASRRACEDLIRAGRVTVNDETVTEMGVQVDPEAALVCLDGRPVYLTEHKVYYILNKPMGVICAASDPFGRRTVIDCLEGVTERIYPVGRLDYETEGLLLLTNDGDFAHRVLHPSFEVEKTYYTVVISPDDPGGNPTAAPGRGGDGVTAPPRCRCSIAPPPAPPGGYHP
ncbi:MAG: pseudouridine synthase [Christensenellaceae bacterium]